MFLAGDDLNRGMLLFDAVSDPLFLKDQARTMRLPIERIDYHAGEETLEIMFRNALTPGFRGAGPTASSGSRCSMMSYAPPALRAINTTTNRGRPTRKPTSQYTPALLPRLSVAPIAGICFGTQVRVSALLK